MAVVVNLDSRRRGIEFEDLRQFPQQLTLRRRFGAAALDGFLGIALRLFHQLPCRPALGVAQADLAPGLHAERQRQQFRFRQCPIEQQLARRRQLLVQLGEEALEHFGLIHAFGVAGEEAAVAPVLAAADEEDLHAHGAAIGGHGDHVGFAGGAFGVDGLAALNEGQRLQPVTQHRRCLEVHGFRRRLHRLGQLLLRLLRAARQEALGVLHQLCVADVIDAAHTRRRAALDLVEQAGPRTVGEETVRTAPEQEHLLQRVQRGIHRAGAGERAIIAALGRPRAAMLGNTREIMIFAQQDEGEAFVVAQQHVVRRAIALDQLGFQQQRFGLAVGGHDLHGAGLRHHALQAAGQAGDLGIVGHPLLQRARLANIEHVATGIEHAIDAGLQWQGLHHAPYGGDTQIKIRRLRTAHRVGLRFLGKTVGRIGHAVQPIAAAGLSWQMPTRLLSIRSCRFYASSPASWPLPCLPARRTPRRRQPPPP